MRWRFARTEIIAQSKIHFAAILPDPFSTVFQIADISGTTNQPTSSLFRDIQHFTTNYNSTPQIIHFFYFIPPQSQMKVNIK